MINTTVTWTKIFIFSSIGIFTYFMLLVSSVGDESLPWVAYPSVVSSGIIQTTRGGHTDDMTQTIQDEAATARIRTTPVPEPDVSFRICTQEERLAWVKEVCAARSEVRTEPLMKARDRMMVDKKHKLMMCWMSKGGCTAFKALLLKANGYNATEKKHGHSLMVVHNQALLKQYGLPQYHDLPTDEATEALKSYFTFMIVRHPFERILSTYRGKVVDKNSDFYMFAASALKLARPGLFAANETLNEMKKPQIVLGPPTFVEFLRWLMDSQVENDHWSKIVEACHPCSVDWSAVTRLETMEHDSKLILERLKPDLNITEIPVRHSHQAEPVHDHDWATLPEYHDVADDIIEFLLERFSLDMEMFGYHWDKKTRTSSCSIQTPNGPCC